MFTAIITVHTATTARYVFTTSDRNMLLDLRAKVAYISPKWILDSSMATIRIISISALS